jgi:hypothetical protein
MQHYVAEAPTIAAYICSVRLLKPQPLQLLGILFQDLQVLHLSRSWIGNKDGLGIDFKI